MEEQEGMEKNGDNKEVHSLDLDLPFDIVKLIAERLILEDYLHFRASCKFFCSVAPPIQWRIASPRLENPSLSPWLMFFEKDNIITFIDPKHGDKYHTKLPPELKRGSIFDPELTRGNIICCSKDGWLLVSVGYDSSFFFNPFTQGIVPLPEGPRTDRNTTCIGFSSTPSSPDCVVVEINKFPYLQTITVCYCSPGEEDWYDQIEFDNDTDFLFYNNTPVFYKEAFHYLGQKGNLGILKLNDEEPSWKVLTKPQSPCSGYRQNFLVECEGELLSIFVDRLRKWVKVFKLNDSAMTWVKVKNLGNYMVYVSHSSSFSAMAKTPGMENKIYFPRLFGQSIVFYSLETNKYHSFESKDVVVDFYSSREKSQCAWIEPRWY